MHFELVKNSVANNSLSLLLKSRADPVAVYKPRCKSHSDFYTANIGGIPAQIMHHEKISLSHCKNPAHRVMSYY